MVINAIAWSPQPFELSRIARAISERWIAKLPRLSCIIVGDGSFVGARPRWQRDASFRVENHLRRHTLADPGDCDALQEYVSRQASLRLERSRPLWEVHLIDGFDTGGALLLRIHHAMADGHLLVRLLHELDESRAPTFGLEGDAAQKQRRSRGPLLDMASSAFARVQQLSRHPERWASGAAELAMIGNVAFAEPRGSSVLNQRLSGIKAYRWLPAIDLMQLKLRCRASGLTVNDFWLAVLSGGLRAYLRKVAESPGDIRVVVPVDLRPADEPLDLDTGNHFGLVFLLLPLSEASVSKRLAEIRNRMHDLKRSEEARLTFEYIQASGRVGSVLGFNLMNAFARHCSAIHSNVPGPTSHLTFGGSRITGLASWVPASGSVGIGMCVQSYAGSINFGLSLDRGIIREPDQLMTELRDELARLEHLLDSAVK